MASLFSMFIFISHHSCLHQHSHICCQRAGTLRTGLCNIPVSVERNHIMKHRCPCSVRPVHTDMNLVEFLHAICLFRWAEYKCISLSDSRCCLRKSINQDTDTVLWLVFTILLCLLFKLHYCAVCHSSLHRFLQGALVEEFTLRTNVENETEKEHPNLCTCTLLCCFIVNTAIVTVRCHRKHTGDVEKR